MKHKNTYAKTNKTIPLANEIFEDFIFHSNTFKAG